MRRHHHRVEPRLSDSLLLFALLRPGKSDDQRWRFRRRCGWWLMCGVVDRGLCLGGGGLIEVS